MAEPGTGSSEPRPALDDRVATHLGRIYPALGDPDRQKLAIGIIEAFFASRPSGAAYADSRAGSRPGPGEVVLITYGDSVLDAAEPDAHLRALDRLLRGPLAGLVETVHVLPFFESSSDGGFSVVDYRSIAEGLGDWADLAAIAEHHRLMVDLVCNHGSAQSEWFQQFLADREPGRSWYLTADPDADLTSVVRPRTHPLLAPVATAAGTRHVWATFSHDQIDFDFSNPDVLVEFCSILGFYINRGRASRVRLDAIAYLWKRLGTSCVHLPETHEVVKLFRTLADSNGEADGGSVGSEASDVLIITETNVPHDENVAYFGAGDEAQVVYNFTLAPLLVWSVLAERADRLTAWLGELEAPPPGCTFLNFIASHDGIGLRPIEDLVGAADLRVLLDRALATGGAWSEYATPDGPRPYELNVSLADLLAGSDGADADRYIAAHAALLALQGLPAFYIHSLLSTPGDVDAVAATGHKRDINRTRLDRATIDQRLARGWRSEVFGSLAHLIRLRRSQPAFAPDSVQQVYDLHGRVLVVERRCADQRLLALTNLSGSLASVELAPDVPVNDLVSGADRLAGEPFELAAWQVAWLAE